MMKRRDFITLLSGAAAWPLAARAQQPNRVRRVGVLMAYGEDDPEANTFLAAFRHGLQDFSNTCRPRSRWRRSCGRS
jgi:putative tryptophan/tyrosine transport system substrate-binding protein